MPKALVSILKSSSKFGKTKTGSDIIVFFNFWKASSVVSFHKKTLFLSNSVKGVTMLQYMRILFLGIEG